jgi:ATP/maltotriose-dependent transcriptional regulator MalT
VLLFSNQLEASSARHLDAERGIQSDPSTEDARSILGPVALIRGNIAMYFGDIEHGIDLCRQALDLLPEAEADMRASAMVGAVRTFLVSGEVTPW